MTEQAVRRLEELARTDPTVETLARMQAEALRAAADPVWQHGVPPLVAERLSDGLPLLHGQTIAVHAGRLRDTVLRVAGAANGGHEGGGEFARHVSDTDRMLSLAAAAIRQDLEAVEAVAAQTGFLQGGALVAVVGVSIVPLLLACGGAAAPLLQHLAWEAGYCPVCAAWPALAELRGLERRRWLRCGRCGAGWTLPEQLCPFCGNDEFRSLGYLAPEADTESRRAVTCDRCRSYLKTLTTLAPIPPHEVAIQDMTTLELDMAALERDYARPDAPGFPLAVQLVALRRTGWLARFRE